MENIQTFLFVVIIFLIGVATGMALSGNFEIMMFIFCAIALLFVCFIITT